MLFNSYEFLFVYLPAVWITYQILLRSSGSSQPAIWFLALASLFFYGWWDYRYLLLLMFSIVFNYGCGAAMASGTIAGLAVPRKVMLVIGIGGDLAALAYFKYANFLLDQLRAVDISSIGPLDILLPLGISFFTFTQIAFLVDAYRGNARDWRFSNYLLFVTYFPHLIAGPIIHHKEMMPQFANVRREGMRIDFQAMGLSVLAIGLAKKVLVADPLSTIASPIFEVAKLSDVSFLEAWIGALAYALQIYFDFSGYCDMAIGISLLFGIKLPLNFASPYKAQNIIEFWRLWHMTLSRFLRDNLYYPLGGNRLGPGRRHVNLMITMLLGGLWHGAAWTFMIWGGLHGGYLAINHGWRSLPVARALQGRRWWVVASTLVTFIAVVAAWVVFRAETLPCAVRIWSAMIGGGRGLVLPIGAAHPALVSIADAMHSLGLSVSWGDVHSASSGARWIIPLLVLVWCAPNTQEIFGPRRIALVEPGAEPHGRAPWLRWTPRWTWAIGSGLAAAAAVLALNRASEFLYYQF